MQPYTFHMNKSYYQTNKEIYFIQVPIALNPLVGDIMYSSILQEILARK